MQQLKKESTTDIIWGSRGGYMHFATPSNWMIAFRHFDNVDKDLKNVSLHGLRHTHATVLFEQAALKGKAAPLKAVQKRLGHANIEMTLNIYTHVTEKENNIIDDILEDGLY